MFEEIVTLTSYSPKNHIMSPAGDRVTGVYSHAQGQFFLHECLVPGMTFNLTISGMGVLKMATFGNFNRVYEWIERALPMQGSCLKVKGKVGVVTSFFATVNNRCLSFRPKRPTRVNCRSAALFLPLKDPDTFLVFDIECGDVQVSITNIQQDGQTLERVFHPLTSPDVTLTGVTMGLQASLKTPIPQSLCAVNGHVLFPETVLSLKVFGPDKKPQENSAGSYFRLWVLREEDRMSHIPSQQDGHSKKRHVRRSSRIFSVAPEAELIYFIVVKSNQLKVMLGPASEAKDVMDESFNQHKYTLWIEFYKLTFSFHKTAHSWDLSEYEMPNGVVPVLPKVPMDTDGVTDEVRGNRNGRRRSSDESINLLDLSPNSPISPSVNNNNFSPMEDVRDFDPISNRAGCVDLVQNSCNPVLPFCEDGSQICGQGALFEENNNNVVSLRGTFSNTADPYDQTLRRSQSTQGDNSYLSVLSQLSQETGRSSNCFEVPGQGQDDGHTCRPLPTSAPIPCPGTKSKSKKGNAGPLQCIAKKITTGLNLKKSRTLPSPRDDSDWASPSGASAREVPEFCNKAFFDGFSDCSNSSESHFQTWRLRDDASPSTAASIGSRNSILNDDQSDAFFEGTENKSRRRRNSSCSSNNDGNRMFTTFKPETSTPTSPQKNPILSTGFNHNNNLSDINTSDESLQHYSPGDNEESDESSDIVVRRRLSANSSTKDSGFDVDARDVFNEEPDGIRNFDRRSGVEDNTERKRLSSYRSNDSHHQTIPKRLS